MDSKKLIMRLIILILSIPLICFSQKSEWQYLSDLSNDRSTPLQISVGDTDVIIDGGFKVETDTAKVYESDGKFKPLENELYIIRFGFDYRIPDATEYAYFKAFLETGGTNPPVPIGEWRVSDHQGWVQHQETFVFWGGTDLAAQGGKIYWNTVIGNAEIANQNLTIVRARDERPTPIVEVSNTTTNRDVATTVVAPFTELFEEVTVNTRPEYFTVDLSAAKITIEKTGIYEVQTGVSFTEPLPASNTQRDNIAFWLETGTATNTANDDNPDDNLSHYFQGNYIRDTSGHLESSDGGSTKLLVVESVPFDIICSRDQISGTGGVINLHTTNNFLRIRKID